MRHKPIKQVLVLAFTVMLAGVMHAQNIAEIAKSDPLVISGAVGTQNTYRYSSVGNGYGHSFNLKYLLYRIEQIFQTF